MTALLPLGSRPNGSSSMLTTRITTLGLYSDGFILQELVGEPLGQGY
jgi:hypothetical protein